MGERTRALRQAVVLLVASAVVALAVGAVWAAVQDAGFRSRAGIALMVAGGLLGLSGGSLLTRAGSAGDRALLGMAPERGDADTGTAGVTGLGVFLFVSLPLFVGGLVLFGRG